MKRLLWLGLLFISTSWLFFIPIFTVPDWTMGIVFLSLGLLFNIVGLWKQKPIEIHEKYFVFLIPLIISLIVIPYPYNVGVFVLTIGLLLYAITHRFEKANFVATGMFLSGLILTFQTALFLVYTIIVSHVHRIDFFSPVASFVGNLFGLQTSVNNGIIFVQTFQQTYPFTTTLEKLGFFTWFNLFIGALILFFLLYRKRKIPLNLSVFLVASFFYLLIRYVSFIYIYINTLKLDIFWCPFYMIAGFLPFALLLMKIIPLKDGELESISFKQFTVKRKHVIALFLVFLFVFLSVGAFAFQDPGTKKSGKLLIDEFHSDWEDTTRELDKEWYGMLSTYNYYSWAEWLDKYYHVERNINETLTLEFLDNYDIVILKCPTNQYSSEEVRSLVQFVERGGGLFLIGDHTDVFGMNTFLNPVSENFGIRFKTDATYELGTGMMTVYKPSVFFPHPIVQHLEQFEFMTSCTLEAPLISENVIIGNRLIGEPGTYSTENFFRESIASPESEYGLLLQVAAVKYGKGRVVAFSDSTVFSSFSLFSDGYQLFTLGMIEWLNKINSYSYLNIVFIAIAGVSLILALYIIRKEKKFKVVFLFFTIGLLSFSIATPAFSYLNRVNYQVPNPHSDFMQVCFEQEHSNFNVSLQPRIGLFNEKDNYGTFYVWTQRVGLVPSIENTLEEAIEKGDIIVIVNPCKSFETEDIETISAYIENGGNALVMDSITNSESTANDLIGNFGMWINYETLAQRLNRTINDSNNATIGNITSPYLTITGGEKILVNEQNQTYANVVKIDNETTGKTGKLVVLVDSYSFSDVIMGGPFVEPDENQLEIYNTEYFIFEEILLKDT